MTSFKNYVSGILRDEINILIEKQGYFLETEFCTKICEKYNIPSYIVRATLRRIYPEMSLLKRRMSDDLKRFYGLEAIGYPIAYLPNK